MTKILVIDDEQPTLMMFRLLLSALGYEARTAQGGAQGIELFKSESPAIVFTDVKMPGMDGLEVLRRIKAISPQTPVIVITGHGDRDLESKAAGLGAAGFIAKPIQRAALDEALQMHGGGVMYGSCFVNGGHL